MTIAVTGASGPFGRHAIEVLQRRGIPADQIVAIVRDPAKAGDLRERGVTVRRGDYSDPASLRAALAGVDRLLFVSGSEVGQRIAQHRAVADAAREAGVSLVAYTSSPKADSSDMVLAEEHRATEGALVASGVPYVFLRNGWYVENYTRQLPVILEHGLIGAAGDGRISAAARGDLAEAAAVVVASSDGHQNRVYELGGPSFTLAAWPPRSAGSPAATSATPTSPKTPTPRPWSTPECRPRRPRSTPTRTGPRPRVRCTSRVMTWSGCSACADTMAGGHPGRPGGITAW